MAKQKTVFVVTSGSYSDYGIEAIYSSEKLAKLFIEKMESERTWMSGDYSIEKWEMNFGAGLLRQNEWLFNVQLSKDGNGKERDDPYVSAIEKKYETARITHVPYGHLGAISYHTQHPNPAVHDHRDLFYVIARDKEHAIRLARELRAFMLNEGVTKFEGEKWPR